MKCPGKVRHCFCQVRGSGATRFKYDSVGCRFQEGYYSESKSFCVVKTEKRLRTCCCSRGFSAHSLKVSSALPRRKQGISNAPLETTPSATATIGSPYQIVQTSNAGNSNAGTNPAFIFFGCRRGTPTSLPARMGGNALLAEQQRVRCGRSATAPPSCSIPLVNHNSEYPWAMQSAA